MDSTKVQQVLDEIVYARKHIDTDRQAIIYALDDARTMILDQGAEIARLRRTLTDD